MSRWQCGGWIGTAVAALTIGVTGPLEAAQPLAIDVAGGVVSTWSEDGRHFYSIDLDGGTRSVVRETSYEILLRYDRFDPLVRVPQVPPMLAAADQAETVELVQFVTQPLEAYREAIRELGGTVYHYIGEHSHLVRMTPAVRAQVATLPFVRWVGPYEPAYRLDPLLVDQLQTPAGPPRQTYNVMVFEAGMQQKNDVANRIAAIGGVVNRTHAGKFLLEATLDATQLVQVASFNEVLFIDLWSPYEADMDNAREIGGANFVETMEGYTGQGVRGEVLDLGFNTAHVDFQDMPLILHTTVNDNFHGASCSGIIFGDGSANPTGRGLLPDGQGIIADIDEIFTGQPRYDLAGELVESPFNAVFQSASVGTEQTPEYTSYSADIDAMLFDFDLIHCQSQSNEGNQNSRPQAWAKNVVSVGGIRHMDTLATNDDCWGCDVSAASIGPAADGRLKPDLCHFFDNIFTVTTGSDTEYTFTFGGTSGATPIVAGYFGLFHQMWSEGIFGNPIVPAASVFENRPHMTTAKAMVINTANQYTFSGLGHDLTRAHQGWGIPNLQNMHTLRNKTVFVDETVLLSNLETATFEVTVPNGEPAVRFTLVYADPPGVPGSTRHRINDLSMKVTEPGGGTFYWGNNGLAADNWSTSGGVANTVDTVENVFVENPTAGTWTVEVTAFELNEDGHVETPMLDADFALVITGVNPDPPALAVRLPDGVPPLVAPGTPTTFPVEVIDGDETAVPGTATLFFRFDGGDAFSSAPMSHLGGIDYEATLPGATCDSTPQFYVSVEGSGGTVVTDPSDAPDGYFETSVGTIVSEFTDDFEADLGWTVNDAGVTAGSWQRGTPNGSGDRGEPSTDYDGSGQCFLTQIGDGDTDVDGGMTFLISPTLDLGGISDPSISFALWYTNYTGGDPNNDLLHVYLSDDDGVFWTLAETYGPTTLSVWSIETVKVADHVTPNATVRIRFEVSDLNAGSIVEAAVDALAVTRFECLDTCPADVNGDGEVDTIDFLTLIGAWGPNPGHPADIDDSGEVDTIDFLTLLGAWGPCN